MTPNAPVPANPLWWAILPASGSASRFQQPAANWQDKLLAPLAGKPLLLHAFSALLTVPGLAGITLVAPTDRHATYRSVIEPILVNRLPLLLAQGGETRRDSVQHGLATVPEDIETILIHDAARPFIPTEDIQRCLNSLWKNPALAGTVLGHPVTDTLKRVASEATPDISETVPRALLWQVQTPQVFRRAALQRAHQAVHAGTAVTDDAQLVEISGTGPVRLVRGSRTNLKITTAEDLLLAESLILL